MFISKILKYSLLNPLSIIWGMLYRIRRAFYEYGILKKDYFKVPIISIGNVTFGGTGKTPMTIWLLDKLEAMMFDVVVLTRGYKGKLEHKSGIIRGGQTFLSNPYEYGDEPLLISKKLKRGAVIVGKKRSKNLEKYFHDIEPDVVLLDDGFQHIQLYRSFNIVLFDALLPLDRYKTAPMGYLREGLSALKDADAIVISRIDQVDEEGLESLLSLLRPYHRKDIPIGKVKYEPTGIYDSFDNHVMDINSLAGKNVIALTAIASPQSFYHIIESNGATIVDKVEYPDHHFFNHADINKILIKAVKNNAIVITSEKDMVKLRKVTKDPRIVYIDIVVRFMSGEEDLLSRLKTTLNLDYT